MDTVDIIGKTKQALAEMDEVVFAYLHGSVLTSDAPHDVDIAVYMESFAYDRLRGAGEINMEFAIPLEMRLEKILGSKVDVQVLNFAPLGFRYRVVTSGVVVMCRDEQAIEDFESLTRVEYFDFLPRRKEYLAESLV